MEKYENVRKIMFDLGEYSGYLINPLCLQTYILKFLQEQYPKNKMNSVRARNASYVFAVLCNEFYLINQNRIPEDNFFVRQERWKLMNVKQKMLESSTKILKKMLLLNYKDIPNPYQPYGHIRLYNINVFRLAEIKGEILKTELF